MLPTMTAVENVALPLMFKGISKRKREKLAKEQLKQMMSASDRKPVEKEEEADEEKPVEIKRMVIPSWSAAQIAESAKNQGDAPDIVRDDVTKVTLFDYSDIIADEKPVRAEEQTVEK